MDLSTLGTLGTETRNERAADLDRMPVAEMLVIHYYLQRGTVVDAVMESEQQRVELVA
ncbi:hypothetical protein ABZ770_41295 [Streptomyces sp. NPDC006654]|uniref:hypothetical protein n=1 Tax=Streptomyces sp. NPDC006654 TaxID=3156897 RepID=UPI0034045A01